MYFFQQSPLYIAIVVYVGIALTIYFLRPTMFFDETGTPKDLGLGENQTIVSYPIFLVLLGVLIYLVTLFLTNYANNILV